jgi:hypothetical protein
MDQRPICLFLARKGLLLSRSTINLFTYSVRRGSRSRQSPNISSSDIFPPLCPNRRRSPLTIVDDTILDTLAQQPFSSIQELAKLRCIPITTVDRHLTSPLGFGVKHLDWGPRDFTEDRQAWRVTLSNQWLRELRSIKNQPWQFILTIDEFWFWFATKHEQIWLQSDQEPPEQTRHTIEDRKMIVTIVWNPLGFCIVETLANARIFNAE